MLCSTSVLTEFSSDGDPKATKLALCKRIHAPVKTRCLIFGNQTAIQCSVALFELHDCAV